MSKEVDYITPETFAPYGRVIDVYLPETKLLPDGITIHEDLEPHRTRSGRFLIPVAVSRDLFNLVLELGNAEDWHASQMGMLCRYLYNQHERNKFTFNTSSGCWDLPIPGDGQEYDFKNRARYPLVPPDNTVAQRKSYAVFVDESTLRSRFDVVDHLCRSHNCANPYHLEVVDVGTNTRRGRSDKQQEMHPTSLFTFDIEESVTYAALLKKAKTLAK